MTLQHTIREASALQTPGRGLRERSLFSHRRRVASCLWSGPTAANEPQLTVHAGGIILNRRWRRRGTRAEAEWTARRPDGGGGRRAETGRTVERPGGGACDGSSVPPGGHPDQCDSAQCTGLPGGRPETLQYCEIGLGTDLCCIWRHFARRPYRRVTHGIFCVTVAAAIRWLKWTFLKVQV